MASNYFSRPFGLHPTPSACWPPIKPPPGPKPTGYLRFITPQQPAAPFAIDWLATDIRLPPGEPETTFWTLDGCDPPDPSDVLNNIPGTENMIAVGVEGFYLMKLRVVFTNGAVFQTQSFLQIKQP